MKSLFDILYEATKKKLTYQQWVERMMKKYPDKMSSYFIKKIPKDVVQKELEKELKKLFADRKRTEIFHLIETIDNRIIGKYLLKASKQNKKLNEAFDVKKMPIIGKIVTKKIEMKEANGDEVLTIPETNYDIVAISTTNNKKFYITNQWHKPGVPLIIADDLVKSFKKA